MYQHTCTHTYSESDFFANMVVDAAWLLREPTPKERLNIQSTLSYSQAHGRSTKESVLVNGYALNCTVASQGDYGNTNA